MLAAGSSLAFTAGRAAVTWAKACRKTPAPRGIFGRRMKHLRAPATCLFNFHHHESSYPMVSSSSAPFSLGDKSPKGT